MNNGLLAQIYSFGNTTRNRLRGLLDDPVGYLQQTADNFANTINEGTGRDEVEKRFALRDRINAGDVNALAEYKQLGDQISKKMFDLATNANPAAVGMIKTQVGRIPETASETRMLADMLQRAGEKSGYVVRRNDSAISPSRYVSFTKAGDEIGDTTRQVRISNHIDKYPELADGIRTSVDPTTEVSFEQAVNWLGREGFPTNLSARYKDVPSWEQYYANQSAARASEQGRLDGLLGAWRNLPKATRGDLPTLDDVRAGMTAIDLMRRGTLK